MSTTGNMKKFGRGYVLDFTALMNEVHSPNQKPPDDITSATATPTTDPSTGYDVSDSRGRHYPTINSDRDSGFGDHRVASGADATPSPTDDDPLEVGQGMNRKATRMSVSRTGRLKNRDRQRISVLQTSEFYGGKPNAPPGPPPLPPRGSIPAAGHHHTVRDANAAAAAGVVLPTETLADFDGVISALDSGSGGGGGIPTQHIKKTDCYSF